MKIFTTCFMGPFVMIALLLFLMVCYSSSVQPAEHSRVSQSKQQHDQFAEAQKQNNLIPPEGRMDGDARVPLIFIYHAIGNSCKTKLLEYIPISVQQAVDFQAFHNDVIFAANIRDCPQIAANLSSIEGLRIVDTTTILSNETKQFEKSASTMFHQTDANNTLWLASALRFFTLLDIMNTFQYDEAIHAEADNMVYGNLSSMAETLRSANFPLAATPLTANGAYITASIFWVQSRKYLHHLTTFFLDVSMTSSEEYKKYLAWLRPYACCRKDGIAPDARGYGIRPFAINEMTILGYFHHLYPKILKFLPIVPFVEAYQSKKKYISPSDYMPGGRLMTGIPRGYAPIWDSGSWGQHLGGTYLNKLDRVGFIDVHHVIGQTLLSDVCEIQMLCNNYGVKPILIISSDEAVWTMFPTFAHPRYKYSEANQSGGDIQCYTMPFVRCGVPFMDPQKTAAIRRNRTHVLLTNQETKGIPWTPLWNLHVHSKLTDMFRSIRCNCFMS